MDRDSIDKVVQGRTKILDAVGGHNRPLIKRRRIADLDPKDVASALSVSFSNDAIGVGLAPIQNTSLEGIEMFLGATDFQPTASELDSECRLDLHC